MYDFIKVCTVTPKMHLGDPLFNTEQIITCLKMAHEGGASLALFPELALTGYYCQDLFFQTTLLNEAEKGVEKILEASKTLDLVAIIGVPIAYGCNLYNTAVVICKGQILGIVPKTHLPNYGEFYEKRWFSAAYHLTHPTMHYAHQEVPIGAQFIFQNTANPLFTIGIDICEDLWSTIPPSSFHALAGATILVNLSASNETIGKTQYRHELISSQSARTQSAYLYTSSSVSESTTDLVFSGHQMIYENGHLLAESELYTTDNRLTYGIIDLERLTKERQRRNDAIPPQMHALAQEQIISFSLAQSSFQFDRFINPHPFVPQDNTTRTKRCESILEIQAHALARRIQYAGAKYMILGMSGGLDSTLALLVCLKAAKYLKLPPTAIMGVTMPGLGTTDRTRQNALQLMQLLGVTQKEISIVEASKDHLAAIGHSGTPHDVTYENAQARERMQILLDLANLHQGVVVGTADLSEMALGWATFGGDHIAMYGVNGGIPKTLVRHLIDYVAHYESGPGVQEILFDILDTPVSPELLPPLQTGEIAQKTEDLVGPYELHDFFIYYCLRFGYSPRKIYFLAQHAFKGTYDDATILKWLKRFYKRFFMHQFKRSSLPDGPKVGSVCLSPRGDLRMPSDAESHLWLQELEQLSK